MKTEQNNAILAEICKLARNLPSGQRDAIVNKCNRIRQVIKRYQKDEDADPEEESAVHGNQRQIVLKWMLEGHTITSMQAIEQFGITRLSAVIFDIGKQTGKAPARRFISVPTRYGKNVRVCEYWIEQDNN